MRFLPRLFPALLACFTLSTAASSSSSPSSVTVEAWPLSASKSAPLATIDYWPEHLNASVKSWTPPKLNDNDASALVRIGLHDKSTGRWTGVATAAEGLSPDLYKTLSLHIDESGAVFGVGFSAARSAPATPASAAANENGKGKGKGKSKSKSKKEKPVEKSEITIEVVKPSAAQPALNKPVVLRDDGKMQGTEEGEQKTLLQKYWWAIALFLLLQVLSAGGDSKK